MMVCIHCALKALAEGDSRGGVFQETQEEHMAKYHPDLEAAKIERIEIEQKLSKLIEEGELSGNNRR